MNIAAVRTAMASALDAAVPNVQVSPYVLANPTPPGIQILPAAVEYDYSYNRGLDIWTFTIQAFVSLNADIGSQKLLDTLAAPSGSGSVKAALEADKTLAGTVNTLRVVRQSQAVPGQTSEGSPLLTIDFTVEVYAGG